MLESRLVCTMHNLCSSSLLKRNRIHSVTTNCLQFKSRSLCVASVLRSVSAASGSGKTGVPSKAIAEGAAMNDFSGMLHEDLFVLASQKVHGARKERLIRNIMAVDNLQYSEAIKVMKTIEEAKSKHNAKVLFPYRLGFVLCVILTVGSVPMVFHRESALYFQEHFVIDNPDVEEGIEVPNDDPETLNTVWKCGNWTWNWMEPFMGVLSFIFLGLALSRGYMKSMQLMPYDHLVRMRRGYRLASLFPQYNKRIVWNFATTDPWDHISNSRS